MRVKLIVTYDGTQYSGWQKQLLQPSVQGMLEKAAEQLTGQKTLVIGSGRTDAGVHALAQVAHMDLEKAWDTEKLVCALNAYLPYDIRVTQAQLVEDTFHARYDAKKKTYLYVMYRSDLPLPLYSNRAVRVDSEFDSAMFEACAKKFEGTHDFASFMSSGSSVKTTVRTVFSTNVREQNGLIKFRISADGFLYNMVRSIAGLCIRVACKKNQLSKADEILIAADRTRCPYTAPAEGLYLESVEY